LFGVQLSAKDFFCPKYRVVVVQLLLGFYFEVFDYIVDYVIYDFGALRTLIIVIVLTGSKPNVQLWNPKVVSHHRLSVVHNR
jgi:hypothetical protein